MGPDLRDIKDVYWICLGFFGIHDLYAYSPDRVVALLDGIEQIRSMILWIRASILGCILRSHILNASDRLEVELAVLEAAICCKELVGVDAKAVDVSDGVGNTARAEEMHYSVSTFLVIDVEAAMLAEMIN